jgi:hypothetical protein
MKQIKEFWKTYGPYFLDIWQYLLIIVLFTVLAVIFL